MPWNKKKSYNLLKSDKKKTSGAGTYTKKPTCKIQHRVQAVLRPVQLLV